MSWATAVVLIVLIAAIAAVVSSRSSGTPPVDTDLVPSPREEELESEVEELRERIHVLERIATDANSSEARQIEEISQEIERLREPKDS